LLAFLKCSKIQQPTFFLAGETDGVIVMYKSALDRLEENVPNLKGKVILPGAGHWVQQEKAEETNRHLLAFLA
jgi:pimeloyl-ACP methyl ester carboxylesterase